jgi:hypothetical protein
MKLYEAKSIITDVFENPFDKEKFSYFIRNLLKNLHPAEFLRSGYNIPKAFEDFIASYERIGKYEDEEGNLIDVLIIKLKRDHSIDYARSTQRNFVRWYLNDKGKDAALVAFHTEKSNEWRFSFIKLQYSLEKKKDELTPAKRSSFMVGESGKSHTAQRQLIDLLKNDHSPFLSDIEDAFSIEAVSDEFYEKYKTLLFNLVDEIEKVVKRDKTVNDEFKSKNISILNFSKKLLGQIVFLYFLQKKGWLGLDEKEKYGEGDKNFLRTLYNKTKPDENFFNDYLEFLFYDALSKKRVTDYYERFKTRIPFLNGGLFDPIEFYDWQQTDIAIPNKIFSDRKSDEEGTGILDVFDLYNFTVKEDEPLETEVAIDPEMLGKVFERMLDVTERKSKGAFYTPREIVHYMAQQSLLYFLETQLKSENVPKEDLEIFIHYGEHIIDKDVAVEEGKLKQTANKHTIPESIRQHAKAIDEALKNIKICDPAVGSGAFPVGIMNEIVKLRKLLTPFIKNEKVDERSAYRFKSNAIQNSIYGVDIDAGAVEIAKLRLWLSMVVDEQSIKTVEPLPNLDYKIVKGNSLINMPDGSIRNGDLENEIEKLTKIYYTITDKQKKQEQKEIIDGKIKQLLSSASEFAGYEIDFDFKLFFHLVFSDNNGFDIVIGNPPFIDHKRLKHISHLLKSFKTYKGTSDIFVYFFERGIDILKLNGILNLISSNKWIRSDYGIKLRQFLLEKNPLLLVDIGTNRIFDATVDSSITFLQKNTPQKQFFVCVFPKEENLRDFKYLVDKYSKIRNDLNEHTWLIANKNFDFLKQKIENTGIPLKKWKVKIYRGVTTGLNEAFIINNQIKERLIQDDPQNKSIIKPIIRGKDVKKYKANFANIWQLFIPWHFPLHKDERIKGASLEAERMFKNNFSVVYNHLLQFKEKLLNRNTDETGKRYEWYALQRCAATYHDEFEKEKIIWQAITKRIEFSYDTEGMYLDVSAFFLTGEHLKYLLAIFNSQLFEFALLHIYLEGDTFKSKNQVLKDFPIPKTSQIKLQIFNLIIDYIIHLKNQVNDKMSFYFEQLIDGMVYELYFEREIMQAGCDVLKNLDDLPEINDEMTDEEKMNIITKVFNKLYDKESPVRKNLFFMDSVEEVAIIKKSLEK